MKLNHIAIPYLAALAFTFGTIVIGGGIDWYRTLTLPPLHPSEQLTAIIWAFIYASAAGSLLLVWNKTPHDRGLRFILGGFALATLLNFVWSVVFFELHAVAAAIPIAGLLALVTLVLAGYIAPRSRTAALLLLPYAAWVAFAAYLHYAVLLLN